MNNRYGDERDQRLPPYFFAMPWIGGHQYNVTREQTTEWQWAEGLIAEQGIRM